MLYDLMIRIIVIHFMSKKNQSIEDLINGGEGESGDDESAQAKFSEKQSQIKRKDIERLTKLKAASLGLQYVALTGFPISPEALVMIDEKKPKCFQRFAFIMMAARYI